MDLRGILLVEDNPDDEELTILALKGSNIPFEIIVVRDGVDALDYLFCSGKYINRDPNHLPQLILLDLKLPKLDGLDVLHHLRADRRTQFIPVVVLTSSNEVNDILSSYRLGTNSFVCKPVEYNRFAEVVRQLGVYWIMINEKIPYQS